MPTINTIILNRATKSLTLYFQMIGRGSRILKEKNTFKVIDLGTIVIDFDHGEQILTGSPYSSHKFLCR